MSHKNKRVFILLLISILLISSWVFGAKNDAREIEQIYTEDFQTPIVKLLYYIDNLYYEKDDVDYDKILDSTLNGLVEGLDDPFAWYFDARTTKENNINESGEYGGLGIKVKYDPKTKSIVVVAPMHNSPAERAGILPKDYIISVNGSSVESLGYYESVDLMRGKPGTTLEIELFRQGWEESKIIEIKRELIETKTVKYTFLNYENNNIAYLRLTEFGEKSAFEMDEALNKISENKINGFVLDLRNNPGGYLNVVIDIASMFIKKGEIVSVKYYNGQQEIITPEPGKYFNMFENIPIVVLVNGGSASASEILTGALRDSKKGVIIGETTFGKAAVQRPIEFSNGGEVWLPIGHYFTPNGEDIHLKGIKPQIEVKAKVKDVVSITDTSDKEIDEILNETTNNITVDINDIQVKTALEELIKKIRGENN
ncbi:S41 family peptidase [Oceanotoga sp. DSM 15011]|jgi:carboxyl-terminal processing protease|uniref:S41 family peptidase n=1 Tax=Oceanotoga sp. DSM 15011 TaxID=2984951 RepID=UPI0021F3F594|nr:S41 family peptidase [Oceanotoga sp. DSM 15011]UYO99594.1 S41 family peptidase [Oceanotoga sp. DSM 15011]